jgi:hypothetical protein
VLSQFLNACWIILKEVCKALYNGGYVGCAVGFIIAAALQHAGVRLTGRPETITIWTTLFRTEIWRNHDAIEGSAQTWFGRLVGNVMQVAGGLLMYLTMFVLIARIYMDIAKRHP